MNDKLLIDRSTVEQALEAMLNFPDDISDEMFESIRALRAALAQQQPEPVQEPLVWEPVVRDRPWPYLTALTQREYDALHADLRWNYKKITPPKAEPVQEPGQDLIPPDSLFVCGQMGAHVTRVRLAEPPKWKLVPTEPTIGMCIAGDEARQNVDDLTRTPAIYRAMIAAAPAAPAAPQQPEPVQEPVAKVELMTTGGNAGLATRIVEIDDHLRERLRPGQLLYTAPPQRPRLTDDEIYDCREQGYDNDELNSPFSFLEAARAVERKVRGEA